MGKPCNPACASQPDNWREAVPSCATHPLPAGNSPRYPWEGRGASCPDCLVDSRKFFNFLKTENILFSDIGRGRALWNHLAIFLGLGNAKWKCSDETESVLLMFRVQIAVTTKSTKSTYVGDCKGTHCGSGGEGIRGGCVPG